MSIFFPSLLMITRSEKYLNKLRLLTFEGMLSSLVQKLKLMYKEYVVVKRLLVVFLVMFAFEVYSEDEKEVVVGNAKELKDIKAKKITWKKDGAKMVLMIRS